ncbi:MAG TPA: ROK family protein [Parafilimonas sp.]|nr:ROK family protein [Parafilimonas sp.]
MGEKKSSYKKRIIKEIYFSSLISCADLSEKINKSLPLTTKMLNELIGEGIVTETGHAASTGGRRPAMYSLKRGVMYVIAVAMDQLVTRIALVDMSDSTIKEITEFELKLDKNSTALFELTKNIEEFINSCSIPKDKIIGVGIGMPGFINSKKGINYTFLSAGETSIDHYISQRLALRVFIDNDSSLIALAELKFGAARNKLNAMVVNISWGIGLGLVLNGELFRGSDGFAGEFSHIPLFNNNKLCECGKSGCLETEASLLVVIEKAHKALADGRPSLLKELPADNFDEAGKEITKAAGKGDKLTVELLSEAGYTIGRGVAILIHILNPDIIILGGRGSLAGKIWLAPIQQALNEYCIPRLGANTAIQISELGYNAELIGAAALVIEHYEMSMIKATVTNEVMADILNNH